MPETFFPSKAGVSGAGSGQSYTGQSRLFIKETAVDTENNTSTVKVEYQVSVNSNFPYVSLAMDRYGWIKAGDTVKELSGSKSVGYTGGFVKVWDTEIVVPHDDDGEKILQLEIDGGQGAGGPSLYKYTSSGKTYCTAVGKGIAVLELTKIDRGAAVYIDGEQYDPYIKGENGFEKYGTYIGDGRSWK